ncbi:MAG: DNA-processing protein DprA [Rothia sp. (in: high G+C Gram-positive bacteria)]|uniref:DNA-processing protein DprA n=1 Tax=Rothia sp. (in: high G+C Gram-positive bacteria) TaxID=1885016 RepID=UPI0026DF95EE|nr:DNA-processing protein DprA [Rothia sp. (in: high G+C Gram-positive bacteria)]MDO5750851.1 DNA-processing protein DprA [Rothia sp. (in: high G+C Gram-positive bacteria)]
MTSYDTQPFNIHEQPGINSAWAELNAIRQQQMRSLEGAYACTGVIEWDGRNHHEMYTRMARARIARIAEPADPIIAECIAVFGPVITCHLLTERDMRLRDIITPEIWESGEPDPALAQIASRAWVGDGTHPERREAGYRPGEHSIEREDLIRALKDRRKRWAERLSIDMLRETQMAEHCSLWYAIPEDPDFPLQLADLGDSIPYGLWGRGARARLSQLNSNPRTLAVVGSRDATVYGQSATATVVQQAMQRGACIISGGAYGIDIIAHRTALLGEDQLPTVAFMAGGLDHFYPAQNIPVLQQVVERGLVLTEVSPGYSPTRWRFLQRNRLIAALSVATVVVEARWRSGALNTVHHALELGRDIWAVPGQIDSPNSVGTNTLISNQLAQILLNAAEIFPEDLGSAAARDQAQEELEEEQSRRPLDDLTQVQGRLWDSLSSAKFRPLDVLLGESGVDMRTAALQLQVMRSRGLVIERDGQWRRANARELKALRAA